MDVRTDIGCMRTAGQGNGAVRILSTAAVTVHLVWMYLSRVKTAFSLEAYEAGQAPVPFQHRLAMRPVLLWADHSPYVARAAAWLTRQHAWFPHGVRPQALVELPIDVLAVAATGLVAERIYARASRTSVLQGLVYPLTLAMVAVVFDLSTIHSLRFIYDLPAMAVFAGGLYLLHTRQPLWRFALLFACGTLNRETTLLLLPALLLQRWSASRAWFAAALLTAWLGWHAWVIHLYAGNVSAAGPRLLLNAGVLLCPFAWPQLGTFAALCLMPLLCCGEHISEPVLRRWRMLVPLWLVFMMQYGLLLETRVFGELIALLAPMLALVLEGTILGRLRRDYRVITRFADAAIVS